jgi:hypothetical protein
LVPEVPEGIDPHVGTTDLDVVIGVAVVNDDEAVYTKLQQELVKAGFSPAVEDGVEKSYAWERRVNGIRVVLEFFCPLEEGGEPGRLRRNPGGQAGSKISALQMKGAELAAEDCELIPLEGEILDFGGRREVEVKVVRILPFLALKAFAILDRNKEKDAYDVVWTLNAFPPGGPKSAAESARESALRDHPEILEGIEALRHGFLELDSAGPSNYARFFLGARDEPEERDQLRRFAKSVVGEFLVSWDRMATG